MVEGHSLKIVIRLISTTQKLRPKPMINGAYRLLQHRAGKLHRSSAEAAVVLAVPLEPAVEDHAVAVVDPGAAEEQVQDRYLLDWP